MAYPAPESVGPVLGALVEPMAVAYRAVLAVARSPVRPPVVFGAGPVGIGSFLALALGIDDVTVVEPAERAGAAVARLGATVLDPASTDVVAAIHDASGKAGAVVIDAAGVGVVQGIAVAGTACRVVTVAAYMGPVSYNPTEVMIREIEIVSSFSYNGEFDAVIGHMAAGVPRPTDGSRTAPFDDHLGTYERYSTTRRGDQADSRPVSVD